jgi:hypothetical protein
VLAGTLAAACAVVAGAGVAVAGAALLAGAAVDLRTPAARPGRRVLQGVLLGLALGWLGSTLRRGL